MDLLAAPRRDLRERLAPQAWQVFWSLMRLSEVLQGRRGCG
jgi:hypothetical protein